VTLGGLPSGGPSLSTIRIALNCKHCSAPVEGRRVDALYCDSRCANRARNRAYYQNHTKKLKADRALRNKDAPKRMYQRVKSRAKLNGIPFNLEQGDISIPEVCPVLGIAINANHGRQGYFRDSPSLDRIVPSRGYTKGNVRVISQRANQLKSDATLAELRLVLADMEKLFAIV